MMKRLPWHKYNRWRNILQKESSSYIMAETETKNNTCHFEAKYELTVHLSDISAYYQVETAI